MNNNSRLGKGLSSLLGERKDLFSNRIKDNDIIDLDINFIKLNKNQPRKDFDEKTIEELAKSIKENGLLQPIIVRKLNDNQYELVSGERRLRAYKKLGKTTIKAIVRDFDDKKSFILSVIENIQREDLNVVEEALAYKSLMDICGMTQNDLAEKVGKSRSHIANILRLLSLSDRILNFLKEGKIEMGHARALINYEGADEVIDYIVDNNLTVRDVEKLVKGELIVDKSKKEKKVDSNFSDAISKKENILKEKLNGFKFQIKTKSDNSSGTIVLSFKNLDELDSLINKIN